MTVLASIPTLQRVKLTAENFLLLDEAGAFASFRKTELIDGDVYGMNAQHRPHARIKTRLIILLNHALVEGSSDLEVLGEGSVALSTHNVPEPDIILTSESQGDGPVPASSVSLVVEVSDTTLAFDLREKLIAYANGNIDEYWIADVNGRVFHQMWGAEDGGYAHRREVPFGEPITAATLPGLTIETTGL